VAKNNPDKKSLGWFRGVLSNQNEGETITLDEEKEAQEQLKEATVENKHEDNSHNILSKVNQDKVALDMILSLENLLKDRQLLLIKQKDLENQLQTANETINRLRQDQMKKDQLIQEKNQEIQELESSLTNKQMAYDQLLENFKEYQANANDEYEKLSLELEKEISKYKKLDEETTQAQYESMMKIKELDAKVRNLEIENQKYLEQYEKIAAEKAELMQTINDFTERMSLSFGRKLTTSDIE
jgi:hypothetical protein